MFHLIPLAFLQSSYLPRKLFWIKQDRAGQTEATGTSEGWTVATVTSRGQKRVTGASGGQSVATGTSGGWTGSKSP